MKKFVFGTDSQYEMLKTSLEDHRCHVYRCTLPEGCSVHNCRIGIWKNQNFYYLHIDGGITYKKETELRFIEWLLKETVIFNEFKETELRFIEWLSKETLIFNDFNDVKTLLTQTSHSPKWDLYFENSIL